MSNEIGEVIIADSQQHPLVVTMDRSGEMQLYGNLHPLQVIDALAQMIAYVSATFADQLQAEDREGPSGG